MRGWFEVDKVETDHSQPWLLMRWRCLLVVNVVHVFVGSLHHDHHLPDVLGYDQELIVPLLLGTHSDQLLPQIQLQNLN